MYFQDQVQLPALVPIRRNKKKQQEKPSDENSQQPQPNLIGVLLAKQFDKKRQQNQQKKAQKLAKPTLGPQKIEQFDKKFHNLQQKGGKKEDKSVKANNNKERENQKSKHIITDMMKKIDAKNIAQQLYPVTNEAILGDIAYLDREVEQLKIQAERKQNSLATNPNNQHLKKQLEVLKISIDRCVTIKELYNQKINLRNKVSILERSIITLKEENDNLRIKNYREGEDIENHSNGQPCYKQRELKDQLTKCQQELSKEKGMREKLENNISDIVQNFKRLYQEADTARLIVTRKLKELQQKQKNMMMAYDQSVHESEKDLGQKKIQRTETMDFKKIRHNDDNSKTNKKLAVADPKLKQSDSTSQKPSSFEDQLAKIKGNQGTVPKNYKR